MKKLILPILLVFITFKIQGQSNVSALQLMELNNGTDIFSKLIDNTTPNIAEDKQADFKLKAEKLAQNKKSEAVAYFEKKYTQKDLSEMYAELKQEDRVSYSEKTAGFLKEWRAYKTSFQSQFKQLYNSFQK